ncbi:hypothetical protein KJ359_001392 [Pestalotiopsis sp. 9143b]|nr:hypothetical protein KJ359_001392 [Pestalotiopsis sp. 9143b]
MDLLSNSNGPSASLTSLPAELRLLIYQDLFRATKIVVSPAGGGGYSDKARKSKSNTTEKGTWQILLSCRAIYAEAMPSYWTHGHLRFYGTWRQLPDALPAVAPLSRISHICLRLHSLSARWDQILEDLAQGFPALQTLVVRDDAIWLNSAYWLELMESCRSSSTSKEFQVLYDEVVTPCLFGELPEVIPWMKRYTTAKFRSRAALEAGAWPRNRILYIPLCTDNSKPKETCDGGEKGAPSEHRLRLSMFRNLGNGRMVLVTDEQKGAGLEEVTE